ncbi:IS200/IS605 family transposase [Shewanella morhuae]|uniref:Transposase and inactivated derivatives n=1 Tax=Shewanella morhuae TaxID=365591 RepID=A0A380C1T6_9GAMM|nr:IS200/IS605 family transposase [Shewanella morhuae]SUJ10230.1 Transposase and inactivated derivatives [Shewanella morhuae]
MEVRKGRHCVSNLHAHLVFVTKYRFDVIAPNMHSTLQQIFEGVCAEFETNLIEFNGDGDHVHLLVEYPPKVALSKLVNSLKGVSSRKSKLYHPEIADRYFKGALWSASYFAGSCGGAPIEIVRKYIENQQDK